jgi:hypothetical protein
MEIPRIYIYDDFFRKWHWKIFAPNPKTRMTREIGRCTEPFETRAQCEQAVEELRGFGLDLLVTYRQSTS